MKKILGLSLSLALGFGICGIMTGCDKEEVKTDATKAADAAKEAAGKAKDLLARLLTRSRKRLAKSRMQSRTKFRK